MITTHPPEIGVKLAKDLLTQVREVLALKNIPSKSKERLLFTQELLNFYLNQYRPQKTARGFRLKFKKKE